MKNKYRVREENGQFYPQIRSFLIWHDLPDFSAGAFEVAACYALLESAIDHCRADARIRANPTKVETTKYHYLET